MSYNARSRTVGTTSLSKLFSIIILRQNLGSVLRRLRASIYIPVESLVLSLFSIIRPETFGILTVVIFIFTFIFYLLPLKASNHSRKKRFSDCFERSQINFTSDTCVRNVFLHFSLFLYLYPLLLFIFLLTLVIARLNHLAFTKDAKHSTTLVRRDFFSSDRQRFGWNTFWYSIIPIPPVIRDNSSVILGSDNMIEYSGNI